MRAVFCLLVLVCGISGCQKPEARSLKDPGKPEIAAGWSNWERPGFSLAAPENWSPYESRAQQQLPPREDDPPGAPPQTGWTVQDKAGDEARMEEFAKAGVPLRLFDNLSRDAAGKVHTVLAVRVSASELTIPDEIKAHRLSFKDVLQSEEQVDLPVGKATMFRVKASGRGGTPESLLSYILVHGDSRYVFDFVTTGDAQPLEQISKEIMATFRAKG